MAKPLVDEAINQDPHRPPRGWVSGPPPGAVHDLTAARIWGILRELAATRLITLARKGYRRAHPEALGIPTQ
jgi:hypothetical protein